MEEKSKMPEQYGTYNMGITQKKRKYLKIFQKSQKYFRNLKNISKISKIFHKEFIIGKMTAVFDQTFVNDLNC